MKRATIYIMFTIAAAAILLWVSGAGAWFNPTNAAKVFRGEEQWSESADDGLLKSADADDEGDGIAPIEPFTDPSGQSTIDDEQAAEQERQDSLSEAINRLDEMDRSEDQPAGPEETPAESDPLDELKRSEAAQEERAEPSKEATFTEPAEPKNESEAKQEKADKETEKPRHYQDHVIVLMYHHLHEEEGTAATLSPTKFKEHLEQLQAHEYQIISMDQFISFRQGGAVPDNAVLLTFDDGYLSFYEKAVPILQEYGASATHFVIGKLIDDKHRSFMSWEQMRELKNAGMHFYSHTYDLHYWVEENKTKTAAIKARQFLEEHERIETDQEYQLRIKQDLQLINERLKEELGEQPQLLAFPFGEYDQKVVEIARTAGIDILFSTIPGITKRGKGIVNRINAGSPNITAERLIETLSAYDQ